MGLLDRASRGFSRAGEETVRVVDYDTLPAEEPQVPKDPKPSKAPKEAKPPRERRKLGLGAASKGLLPAKKASEDEVPAADIGPYITPAPVEEYKTSDTAFAIDDDEPNFYEEKQKLWDSKTGDAAAGLVPDDGAIQDVLDVLKIPATFTIHEEVLMPSDFKDLDFDIQVPQGYDVGQVQFFVEKAQASIVEYLRLLESRNKHVAQLATAVDRLQVDANNLKYDNQIAAGIGIMPTSDSVDLENANMELKLQLQKLKDAQRTTLNSEERKVYEEMRNELSKVLRENEDLKEKNYELRTLMAQQEENADDMVTSPAANMAHEAAEIVFQNLDDEELPVMPGLEDSLPELADDAMPEFSASSSAASAPPTNSSFDVDENDDFRGSLPDGIEDEEAPVNMPATSQSFTEEDDDDELDQLMRDWKVQ